MSEAIGAGNGPTASCAGDHRAWAGHVRSRPASVGRRASHALGRESRFARAAGEPARLRSERCRAAPRRVVLLARGAGGWSRSARHRFRGRAHLWPRGLGGREVSWVVSLTCPSTVGVLDEPGAGDLVASVRHVQIVDLLQRDLDADRAELGGCVDRGADVGSFQRSDLNAARISLLNSSGSSHAAKWPPLSTSLK